MKNIFQKHFILFVLFLCMFFLSGCREPSDSIATDMVVLVGNHSNSAKIEPPIEDAVEKVYSSFGNIAIIAVDGSPTVAKDANGNIIGSYSAQQNAKSRSECEINTETWEKKIFYPRKNKTVNEIKAISADSPEVDLITSLFEAIKALNSIKSSDSSVKEIIIIDTGLSTTGPLSFLDDALFALVQQGKKLTPEDVVQVINDLDARASLPDLDGITVTWYGLGSVCSPQPEMTPLEKYNLRIIWGEILKAGNALKSPYSDADPEYGMFIDTLAEGQIDCDYTVTPIISTIEEDERTKSNDENEPNEDHEITIVPLPNEKIEFIKNSSDYVDNEIALSVLEPYAENLLVYQDINILLVGTVSDPKRNGGDVELSQKRAETVKCSLVELGVSENRIIVRGIGSNKYLADLYNANEWQGNEYIEQEAQKNRAVYMMSIDSDLAQEILRVLQ